LALVYYILLNFKNKNSINPGSQDMNLGRAELLVEVADENGDGGVDFEEAIDFVAFGFFRMNHQDRNDLAENPESRQAFNDWDVNGDGRIDVAEARAKLKSELGFGFSDFLKNYFSLLSDLLIGPSTEYGNIHGIHHRFFNYR
jgi:Ca2+-binding EF-hand superfamily protein